ncbi:MAG TPA: LPS export ABC transporter permease LptG [Coxiellaceae bacterium]|nr:LPS export ABC transporter permease LptG [Coxiellaceae bacterium]
MLILTRYIIRSVIIATGLVVLVLLGVETFLGLAAQLSEVGRANYTILTALHYVLLFDPLIIYRFFPIACLLGSLIGLGALASSHQLVVMRASGFSILQVMWAVIKASLIMLVLVVLIGEGIGPHWVNKAILLKQQALGQGNDNGALEGFWLKQGSNFIHVDKIVSDGKIEGITQYRFNANNQLEAVLASKEADLKNDLWQLRESSLTQFASEQVSVKSVRDEALKMKIKAKLVALGNQSSDQESLRELFHNYRYRHQMGLSYTSLELAFWQRVFEPLTVIVMICLGVPFVFGSLRDTGVGTQIMTGGALGFGFYMFNQFSGRISLAMSLPPFWAALAPMILFSLLCVFLLWRTER